MRGSLLVGGLLLLVVGIVLDVTSVGAIIGFPVGAIGVVIIILGVFTGSGNKTTGRQLEGRRRHRHRKGRKP